MSLAQLFFLKETFREHVRRWRHAHFRRQVNVAPFTHRASRFSLEALEPRLLLSVTASEVVASQQLEPAAITVPAGSLPNLDVDLNGQADALTDGIVIIRHLFGFTGQALVDGAVDPAGQRTDPTAIQNYLNGISSALDVDQNQQADALSDGIMIMRSLFGFTGTALTGGAIDPAGQRTDPAVIATFLDNMNPQRELVAPLLTAGLQQDTGLSASDAITFDPTLTGTLTDINQIAAFTAGFDATPVGSFVDILADLQTSGTFTLSTTRLNQLAGGTLADGTHTLHLRATDARGNVATLDRIFTLDSLAPLSPTFDLALTSDTGTLGDQQTAAGIVTLKGQTDATTPIQLVGLGTSTLSNGTGTFQLPDLALAVGANVFTLRASDVAGNQRDFSRTITRLAASQQADVVLTWNQTMLEAIRLDATPPPMASRGMAMVSLAMYDTINAIEGTPGYYVSLPAQPGSDPTAAAASAAHQVLSYLYPGQQVSFDTQLAASLASIPDGAAKTNGLALGQTIADAIIAIRATDGWNDFVDYIPGTQPGQWQLTGPMYDVALLPQWADLTPFALTSPGQFRPAGPPALDSAAYAAALNEVKALGSATGSTRTVDQTQIARFWADGGGTYTPPGHWDQIAQQIALQQGNSLSANARLFAQLNVALADAGITAWNTKYADAFWRPVTAIQQADLDGNALTTADPTWSSFLITPPFPEYISGHSTFSGAAAEILTSVFGANVGFTTTSLGLPGVTRTFTSFEQAAQEAGKSRIYGGIHFEFSNQDGLTSGKALADFVLNRFTVTTDTQGPTILLNQQSGTVTKTNLTLTGQVLDNLSGVAALQAKLDTGAFAPITVSPTGTFSLPTTLALNGTADGAHTFTFQSTDNQGNVSTILFSVTLDTTAPTITLTAPIASEALTASSRLTGSVSGTGSAITKLTYGFDGGQAMPITIDPVSGVIDEPLDLSTLTVGNHTLAVTAIDAAGNVTTTNVAVSLAALIPLTITNLTPASGSSDVGSTFHPQVFFSRPINSTTLNANNFFATDSAGTKLAATIVPSQDGTFAWLFFTNPMPGGETITLHVDGTTILGATDGQALDADGNGTSGGIFTSTFSTVSLMPIPGTTITGRVFDPGPDLKPMTFDDIRAGADGILHTPDDVFLNPIAHAKVFIVGLESQAVFTDAQGNFTLTNVPGGNVKVAVDGRTATNAPVGIFFPEMVMDATIEPGLPNTLMGSMGTGAEQRANETRGEVYLPRLQTTILQTVSNTQSTVVGVTAKSAPDLTAQEAQNLFLTVPPDSAVGPDGQTIANVQIGISTVPPEMIRDMLPAGLLQLSNTITIQARGPNGEVVDRFTAPIQLTFPNVYAAAPGTKLNFYSFDHTTGKLVIEGTATVSADGLSVTTDPGQGITKPGWHGVTFPGVLGIIAKARSNPPKDLTWPEIAAILGKETASFKGTASELLAAQIECLAQVACDNSDAWGNGWIKNVFNGLARDSQARQNGELRFSGTDGLFFPNIGLTGVDYLGDFVPNVEMSVPGVGEIRTNDLIMLEQGIFRHFLYELLPYFIQNASHLHDRDANGNYLHDDLFNQAVVPCFQMMADMGLMSPVASKVAQASVPWVAEKLRETIFNAGQGVNTVVDFVDDLFRSAPFSVPLSTAPDSIPSVGLVAHQTLRSSDIFSEDIANAGDLRVESSQFFVPVKGTVDLRVLEKNSDGSTSEISRSNELRYYAVADSGTVSISADGRLTVNSTNSPLANIPSLIYVVVQKGDQYGVAQFAITDSSTRENLLSDSYLRYFTANSVPIPVTIQETLEFASSQRGETITRPLYYVLENLENGTILRGQSSPTGSLSGVVLAPNAGYRAAYWDPQSLRIGERHFSTGLSGGTAKIPAISLAPDTSVAGNNGLSINASFVLGANPEKFDNFIPGISDLLAAQQGLIGSSSVVTRTGIIASLSLQGEAKAITLEGSTTNAETQTAYVATGSYGLAIVDASQFQKPVVVSQLDLPGDSVDVSVDASLAIAAVASGAGGLNLVNVVTPNNPTLLQNIAFTATQVEVFEGIAYASRGAELRAYDLLTGEKLATYVGTATITGLAREGTMLYTMDSGRVLRAIDISTGGLSARGSLTMPDVAGNGKLFGKLFVGNGIAYVAAEGIVTGGFATANVSNPDALVLISGVDATNLVGKALAANGSGLAVSVGSPGNLGNLIEVLNVSDPANTGVTAFITQYTLPADPFAVSIAAGIAFVADGTGGLQVVNYRAFDNQGQAPTISITSPVADLDPARPGIQVQEGTTIPIQATLSDDVQVRNVEVLVNGQVVRNEVSFPFDLSAVLPTIAQTGSDTVTIQVRATDTGGNATLSNQLTLNLLPDTLAPTITSISPTDGSKRGQAARTVVVNFSEAMDDATLTAANIQLIGPSGAVTPTDIQVRTGGHSAQFTYAPLAPGSYQVVINQAAVKDRAGNAIGVGTTSSTFTIALATVVFTNAAGGGFWDVAGNWDGNVLPTATDDVLIDAPGNVTIIYRQGTSEIHSLTSANPLTLSGGILTVAATVQVNNTFTLAGGTLKDATVLAGSSGQGVIAPANIVSRLDGVVLDANLLVAAGGRVIVSNGLTLNGIATLTSVSSGTVTALDFEGAGTQTLGGTGRVQFGGTSSGNLVRPITAGGSLVIGPGIVVEGGTGSGTIGNGTLGLLLQGQVRTAGRSITLAGNWTTTGTTAGTIDVTGGGTVNLGGTFTTADLDPARLTRNATSTIVFTGTLDNTNQTLTLEAGPTWQLAGGRIIGGSVAGSGGLAVVLRPVSGVSPPTRLDGVVLDANLVVAAGGQVIVNNGLTLNGIVTLTSVSSGTATLLDFEGTDTQTLGGTGRVVFGGTSSGNQVRPITTGGSLVIGPGIVVEGGTGSGTIGNGTLGLLLQGQVRTAGRSITLAGNWTTTGTTAGTIDVTGGGTVNLGGTFTTADLDPARLLRNATSTIVLTGTLDNTNQTLALEAGPTWQTSGGRITGGTVAGAGTLGAAGFTTSRLDGVVLNANLLVAAGGRVIVNDGLTLNGIATLTSVSPGTVTALDFEGAGTQTLGGTGRVVFGGTSSGNQVRPITAGGSLVIGPGIVVEGGTGSGTVGSGTLGLLLQGQVRTGIRTITIRGTTISNGGTLSADASGGILAVIGSLSNSGTISITPGALVSVTGTYSQAASGSLGVQIGGLLTTQFGRLTVTGTATLDGVLTVSLVNGFIPVLNDRFRFLTDTSRTGSFATTNGLDLGGGLAFQVDQSSALSLDLVTVAAASASSAVQSDLSQTSDGSLVAPSVGGDLASPTLSLPSEVVLEEFTATGVTDATASDLLTNLASFRLDEAFQEFTGQGMTAVIIDTGIDVDHPFFGPDADHNGVADRIVFQWDFADNDADASDRVGHGSHIASLIGSEDSVYQGVAPEADLIALKVFSDTGTGTFAFVEQALQWVAAHAVQYSIDVVNLSLGDGQNWTTPDSHYGLGDEFAALANDGIIVVAAAGNNFFTAQSRPGVSYPAADPNVIGVGAVWTQDFGGPWRWSSGAIDLTTGPDRIASFSQRDATMTEIFAPGARLTGANQLGGIVTMQGTSQSAAYLSGTALLAQQIAEDELGRKLTPQEFTDLVVRTGSKIVDGDDEQDNVVNTGLTFARVNMAQLAKGIHRYEDKEGHGDGHHHGHHGFALAYAQRCWVKDFLSEASTTADDTGDDFFITLA